MGQPGQGPEPGRALAARAGPGPGASAGGLEPRPAPEAILPFLNCRAHNATCYIRSVDMRIHPAAPACPAAPAPPPAPAACRPGRQLRNPPSRDPPPRRRPFRRSAGPRTAGISFLRPGLAAGNRTRASLMRQPRAEQHLWSTGAVASRDRTTPERRRGSYSYTRGAARQLLPGTELHQRERLRCSNRPPAGPAEADPGIRNPPPAITRTQTEQRYPGLNTRIHPAAPDPATPSTVPAATPAPPTHHPRPVHTSRE